jgi:NosR/NirI family nitrous oxide reductase transcriptional regulator
LRQLGRLSIFRVKITPDECIHCRLCEDACPFGAIEKPTVQWPRSEYARGRIRLLTLFCLLPVFVAAGIWGGYHLHPRLALNHPVVRLAQQVQNQQIGSVEETTDEIKAFYTSGQTLEELNKTAGDKQKQFAVGAAFTGGVIGLIASFTLIVHSIFWKRSEYEAQRTGCVACGRCYNYCPRHRKWLSEKNG